jgi:hypothetical protein
MPRPPVSRRHEFVGAKRAEIQTPSTDMFEELFRTDPGWHERNPVSGQKGCESALFHERHIRIANLDNASDQPVTLEPNIMENQWHGPVLAKKIQLWLTRQQANMPLPPPPAKGAKGPNFKGPKGAKKEGD